MQYLAAHEYSKRRRRWATELHTAAHLHVLWQSTRLPEQRGFVSVFIQARAFDPPIAAGCTQNGWWAGGEGDGADQSEGPATKQAAGWDFCMEPRQCRHQPYMHLAYQPRCCKQGKEAHLGICQQFVAAMGAAARPKLGAAPIVFVLRIALSQQLPC